MKLNKKSYLLLFVLLMGFYWAIPIAFSEDKPMDHGSMCHSHQSSVPAVSGGEYRAKQPDTMDNGHMDHGENDGSIIRTKGDHDDMG